MSDQICYSAKYYDDDHEYRYVCLHVMLIQHPSEGAVGASRVKRICTFNKH